MTDLILLLYLLNRKMYDKYYKYLKITDKNLSKIYGVLKHLMDTSTEEQETVLNLELHFFTQYPFMREAERGQYKAFFERMNSLSANEDTVENLLKRHREAGMAEVLANLALQVTNGEKTYADILDHIEKVEVDKPIEEETPFVTDDLEELYKEQIATPGLRWRLDSLNHSLGSLRRGDFGFLFARPETGKTTFLASEITHMATQTNRPILWFNNEEQGEKVMLRCIQAALGLSQAELWHDMTANKQLFYDVTKRNIKIVDNASMHKSEVERICKAYNPALIIFDQIDKIKGFNADRNDLELGACYIWARELAKQYAPVIGVTQASGEGEGTKWLHMGHVANAKTAKQAEADWIVGIGKSNDDGDGYSRYINISKNKLQGDADTIPDKRHGKFAVVIEPEIARYSDINYG